MGQATNSEVKWVVDEHGGDADPTPQEGITIDGITYLNLDQIPDTVLIPVITQAPEPAV